MLYLVVMKGRLKDLYPYLFIFIFVSLIIFLLGSKVSSDEISEVVQKAGVFGPLLYILIFASTHVIAPLSGTPVFFAGFGLFGDKIQIYTYLATMLSAIVNFWISRIWGRDLVKKLAGKDLEKIDEFTKDYGIKSLIFLRVFQGHLVDFISYAYGLTNIKFTPYIIVSALAPIPWLLFWQFYIFPRVEDIGDFSVWFLITLVPFIIISWFFFRYKRNKEQA